MQVQRQFLTALETAAYLGCSIKTIYHYTFNRTLPFYKLQGRKLFFKISDLEAFVLGSQNLVKSKEQIEGEAKAFCNSKERVAK